MAFKRYLKGAKKLWIQCKDHRRFSQCEAYLWSKAGTIGIHLSFDTHTLYRLQNLSGDWLKILVQRFLCLTELRRVRIASWINSRNHSTPSLELELLVVSHTWIVWDKQLSEYSQLTEVSRNNFVLLNSSSREKPTLKIGSELWEG